MKKLSGAAGNREGGRFFNFRPALFAAAFFALGIGFARARLFSGASLLWLLCGVPVLISAPAFFPENPFRSLAAAAALLLFFVCGGLCFRAEVRAFSSAEQISGECTVVGTVTEKSDYGTVSRVVLSDLIIDGKGREGKLVATLGEEFSEKAALSRRVVLVGRVETDLSLFGEYGFQSENVEKKIYYSAEAHSLSAAGEDKDVFLAVRSRLRDRLYRGMDEEPAAVTYALLIGDTSGISAGLLESVRYGGIAHIFSVSGLNIGSLYVFFRALTDKTRLRRLPAGLRFAMTGGALVFYAGVCGFSASVLRATVMCLVLYASSLFGVKSDMLENTGIAALLLLAVHPVQLFDLGFGLSFAACLSIGVLSRTFRDGLDALLPFGGRPEDRPAGILRKIRGGSIEFLAVSLAAQAGTLPLLLGSFGYISVWSLALNCIFVPFVDAVFSLLLALALVACLLPASAAPFLLYLPSAVWSAALLLFHAFDFSLVIRGMRMGVAALPFVGFFLALSDKVNAGRGLRLALCAIFLAAFAASLLAASPASGGG